MASSTSSRIPIIILATILTTITTTTVTAQPNSDLKYKFFCGSSFADIQSDTCSERQWCPSSADDECLVPGHTCFANTPCDARDITGISVPTYSLSLHNEYRDPTDKMFCGTDYTEATRVCEAGGDAAKGRHCPDMNCPAGQTCYIDLPCSYFVLTNPAANPLGNIEEVASESIDLPNPGDLESNFFCGATFQQAAASCSSQTWCRTGTSQECPNGQTCFVSVNTENPKCEINAIMKAEYEFDIANSRAPSPSVVMANTPKPTNSPLQRTDPKNRMFCGTDWNDASSNCALERHCPNGDGDCDNDLKCFDYTQCDAWGMSYMPTRTPTPEPTNEPTKQPINVNPTQKPTTSKPSRLPTAKPTGVPTPKPTLPPSKPPTYMPLAYGDFRREFWCGISYFDAQDNCAKKCPGGQDEECPGNLICLSGVNNCKNEMGMAAYENAAEGSEEEEGEEGGNGTRPIPQAQLGDELMDLGDVPQEAALMTLGDENLDVTTPKPTTPKPSRTPTRKPQETTYMALGEKQTASKPSGNSKPSGLSLGSVQGSTSNVVSDGGSTPAPTLALEGPYYEEMVRIILYGITGPLDGGALNRWKIITKMYIEDFFNKYPTQKMVDAGDMGSDQIRASVYDVIVEIEGEVADMAPDHDFSPLVVGAAEVKTSGNRRNLRSNATTQQDVRQTQEQVGLDPNEMIMVTYSQTAEYRSSLDVINDDPSLIYRRPLETPEYRAEYVNYLRAQDFATFGNLEYASMFMYTEFPTGAPSLAPTPKPSVSPIVPGQPTQAPQTEAPTTLEPTGLPPTPNPTENFGCNLCRPGQCGINANVIFNGEVSSCMEVYNWHLTNLKENSGQCRESGEVLNSVCCRPGCPYPPGYPTAKPSMPELASAAKPDANPPKEPAELDANPPKEPAATPNPTPNPTPKPTPRPVKPTPSKKPTPLLEIPVDDMGLPDADSLAETYYCGSNWDAIDCETATACPSGSLSDCPNDEQCIAFTNCGGKFAFVSDPNVDGGGPNSDAVRSTFYCGTSMQFLEMKCDGATPCPNGPAQCEGDGENYGCFAFTGCNEQVDPGQFVGFLKPPDEDDANGPIPQPGNTFYCASNWDELNSKCVDGVPQGSKPCPSGDILECGEGEGCFANACGNMAQPAPAPSSNNRPSEISVADMDVLKSTFFCGTSIEEIDGDCDNAIPCPTGDECPQGYGCFAFSQCGGVDIESLVDTFGDTERPTRAPSVPVEQVCDEQAKMSVNVGYWQSWSIYRDEECQQMDTASFDGGGYTHIVYSFASIDAAYRLEAWNGTYDNEVPLYKDFNTVKQRHSGVKTMIAVGGWTHNDPGPMQKRFSQMASSKQNRVTFANSVVQFLRTYGFDGLDLDWEYPGLKERGGKRADYDNYVLMTKEIRGAFNRAPEDFELSVAITGNTTKLEMGFDLAGLAEQIDFFNIMAYDLWGSWDPKQIAYSHTDIRMIDEAVEYMSHFIQRSKLVMGLGSYARTYTLEDDDCLDLGCPFEGPGKAGCEGTDGFLPYFEIADLVTERKYDYVRFDDETESMVMVTDGNRLISYDNTVSFNRKLQYAEEMCFMGQMLWAIDMLKDGSNPLTSSNGNSAATGDPSDQSFCGIDYQDVISGCKQPCTSGDSSQCPPGQFCFANTGCSIDNIGAPPATKCRLCPDPSTQGMKDWLEVSYDGEDTTCGDADMAVIGEFEKGSEQCDSAKQSLGEECCYYYPDDPCMLCRSDTEFMDLRALAEIEFDGETMTCFDLSKRLGPEENDSSMCMAAQKEHWDACCYNQCTLCQGQGIKWWNEVEVDEEPLNCGELDAKLYADETEEEDEECSETLDEFQNECCYDYPDDPCDVCTDDGKKLTLMPNEEVEYEGSTFTCAEVNNFLSPFESSSKQCAEVKGLGKDTCCFDRCSLCGEGARLDPEVLVELPPEDEEEEEGGGAEGSAAGEARKLFPVRPRKRKLETGTCADIESSLFQDKVVNGDEKCTEKKSLYYDSCCFEIPETPCQLCATDEYMHHTTTIEFNDDEVSCRSAANFLMERHEMTSDTCSDAKATIGETCCYSTCDLCGEFDLDWDVYVNFEGEDMSCGDFNEIFREEAVVDGSQQCEALKGDYVDTCCYSSPTTSCQLCKQGDKFFDLNDNVEVDFNGPTTCYEVANFMSRRSEDTDPVCQVTQASLFDECCYEKCNLADKPGTYPDWSAEVEMDGNIATCLELEAAIKDAAIPKDTQECTSLQDAFSPICSYTIPENACDICPENAVSITAKAEWKGTEMMCSDIKSRISSREESGSQICTEAQSTVQESCCIDQCEICEKPQKTDFVLTVYHQGETKQCTEIDTHFYEKSILDSSEECSATKSAHSDCCYDEPQAPCNLCKRDTEFFDVMGTNSVSFMGQKMSCSDVSDMMFRREEEDGEMCSTAKEDLFEACCDTKCSLCPGQGLEAGVKVSYEGRMMTCLELDLGLGPASIESGSDQCNEIMNQHSESCCYDKPENPCRICPGDNIGVDKEQSVNYLGTETTCDSLSNYLGSREEQSGESCQKATTEHSENCCYERCSLCGDGKADWETFVSYEGQSIACGDFEWILRGKNVEAGSDQCNAVKDDFFDKCCFEQPSTSCNLCHTAGEYGGEYKDVNAKVEVNYQGSPMKCLSLYNSMFVRESTDSDQCQAAKDDHAEDCCFEKCKICKIGFLDTAATVNVDGNEVSCTALDMSFSKEVVVEGTEQCTEMSAMHSDACCYTIPDNPCRVCPSGSDALGDVSLEIDGETKKCSDVANKLAMSEEAGSDTCSLAQNQYSEACCFERCAICPDGYNLNWEIDVEYNRATIACGEFDNILRGNAIEKGTGECSTLRSTYSSACCYNYATSGVGYAAATTLATVTTTGSLSTNLDTSDLTPGEMQDTMRVFEKLIADTLTSQGVLPPGSTVTVTNIDENGVVYYEIEMVIDDAVAGSVNIAQTPTRPSQQQQQAPSRLGDLSLAAVNEIDDTLSNPTILDAITNEIKSEAPQASDTAVAEELGNVEVTDFTNQGTSLMTRDEAEITTSGVLDTNIDVSNLDEDQLEQVAVVVEDAVENTLEAVGIINPAEDIVTVTGINDQGDISYEVEQNVNEELGAALGTLSNAVASQIDQTLSNQVVMDNIANDIRTEAAQSSDPSVAQNLGTAAVAGSSVAVEDTEVVTKGDSTEVQTTGVLDTNINLSNLNEAQQEQVQQMIEKAIQDTLEAVGLINPDRDTVTVTDIDNQGGVSYEIGQNIDEEVDSALSNLSDAVSSQIDETLNTQVVLEAIADEIKSGAPDNAVAEELSTAQVTQSTLADSEVVANEEGAPEVQTTGVLSTNIDVANLDADQRGEVQQAVEEALQKALEAVGVITPQDNVVVTDISDQGEVSYEVDQNVESQLDSTVADLSSAVASQIDTTLNNPVVLQAISDEIKTEAPQASSPVVTENLQSADVTSSAVALDQTKVVTTPEGATQVQTTGVLETNLDVSNLNADQQEEVQEVVEESIKNTLQAVGLINPEEDTVAVTGINNQGEVAYEIDQNINTELNTALGDMTNAVSSQIDDTLNDQAVLEAISDELKSGAPDDAVAEKLSTAEVTQSTLADVSVTKPGESTEVNTAGLLQTNLDVSGLSTEQQDEVKEVVEESINAALKNEGVLSADDAVLVTDVNDQGEVSIEVGIGIDSTLDDISVAVATQIDETLKNPVVLDAITEDLQGEAPQASAPNVAQELQDADVTGSKVDVEDSKIVTTDQGTEVKTTGVLDTNFNPTTLTNEQKEEVQDMIEKAIQDVLEAVGVFSSKDTVTVTDITDDGQVVYELDQNINSEIASEIGSALDAITSVVVSQIDDTLSSKETLDGISDEIKSEAAGSSPAVAEELSNAELAGVSIGETSLINVGESTEISTTGTIDTNIDTSDLSTAEKEEAKDVLENSIETSLQSEGILPEESDVVITDIDEDGTASYEIDLAVGGDEPQATPSQQGQTQTSLQDITDAVVSQIDEALSNSQTLDTISQDLQAEAQAANSPVADKLSGVEVQDFTQGETSVEVTGAATGAGPCNLCKAGEIGLSKEILFNGAQTSCPEIYKFLSTQAEAGSESCEAGRDALHDECCMKKCDLCSAGGIPDWYAEVNVNGNSMTCLELDGIVAESEIASGGTQCSQLLEVASSACCYEPPTKPCNMCQNGSESNDVMSSVIVEYGGTTATCGQIFNTLFSREEHDSETCGLIKQDLASQCCYNKCSLCGNLQTNAAVAVMHDETQFGCSEFDSYIFASNLIEQGSGECSSFQGEHRDSCCYDISCSLCSKGGEIYTTKETTTVQYGGAEVTCGEVANFLFQEELSQGNACLAAQENIFNECCFQQCEMCEDGASINWAASTTFAEQSQSCTDVYWLLVSESVEAGTQTCASLGQVSRDCCFQVPSTQCTLCKDDNGATYNTRWNNEVTVNGVTKTCGDFNTLLATQEEDSQTCSMAKDEIFGDCCFAGSDTLVAIANQDTAESDASCSLCQPGQLGINGNVDFNNESATCEGVYNFLIEGYKQSSTTCKSAQVKLAEDCCRDPEKLASDEEVIFGGEPTTATDNEPSVGQGSITAEETNGDKINPPMEFDTWSRRPSGSRSNAVAKLCTAIIGGCSFALFMMSY